MLSSGVLETALRPIDEAIIMKKSNIPDNAPPGRVLSEPVLPRANSNDYSGEGEANAENARFLVTVKDAYKSRIDDVIAGLESEGFKLQRDLPHLQTLIGTAPRSHLDKLRKVPGVSAAEPEGELELDPIIQ